MPKSNREKARELRIHHPSWTLQEIGDELHLTRERVRQLLKSESLQTKGYFPRKKDRISYDVLYHFNPYILAGTPLRNKNEFRDF